MDSNLLKGYYRHDVLRLLEEGSQLTGIELGVAGGTFSKRMLDSGRFKHFFGVDMYADHHDVSEYKRALRLTDLFSPYRLLRMTFDDAFDLFDDLSFDFMYVDGYAHTGEEGGDTIYKWYSKLKIGGVIAGDDYHADWPLVVNAVNTFAELTSSELYVTELVEDIAMCKYPSWAIIKTDHQKYSPQASMVAAGKKEAEKMRRRWAKKRFIREYVKPTLRDIFKRPMAG